MSNYKKGGFMKIETILRKSQLRTCIKKMKIKTLKSDQDFSIEDAVSLYEAQLGKITERHYFKILKKAKSLIKKRERVIERNTDKLIDTIYRITNEVNDIELFKKKYWSIHNKIKYQEIDDTKEILNDLITIAMMKHVKCLSKYTTEIIKKINEETFERICDEEENENNELIFIEHLIESIQDEE